MEASTVKYIQPGMFCTIAGDNLDAFGYSEGETVLVMGTQVVPSDEKDPYNLRLMLIVAKYLGEGTISEDQWHLVDNTSLTFVSDELQEQYTLEYEAKSSTKH